MASSESKLPNPKSRWIERLDDKPVDWLMARLRFFEDTERNSVRSSAPRVQQIRELRLLIRKLQQPEPDAAASSAAFAAEEEPLPTPPAAPPADPEAEPAVVAGTGRR